MKISTKMTVIGIALGWAALAGAQAPPDAPAGTNGICNDGTYSQSAHKQGACRGHQGVKQWYTTSSSSSSGAASGSGATMPPAAAPSVAPSPAASPPPAAPMSSAKTSTSSTTSTPSTSSTPAAKAAAGGGPGLVWLNTSSNVYHCQGDRWYGKTKSGAYMSEADAKAKGDRADHNKPCGG